MTLKRSNSSLSNLSEAARPAKKLDSSGALSRIAAEQQRRQLSTDLSRAHIRESDAQATISQLEGIIRVKETRIERLEKDRQLLLDRAAEKSEDRQEAQSDSWNAQRIGFQNEIESLKIQVSEIQDSAEQAESATRAAEHARTLLQDQVESMQQVVEALENELATVSDLVKAKSMEVDKTRDELNLYKTQALPSYPSSPPKDHAISQELKRQVKYVKTLEATNARLQSENSALRARDVSVATLREEKKTLETKAATTDDLRTHLAEVELERNLLVSEKEEWSVYFSGDLARRPHDMARTIATMKIQYDRLVQTHVDRASDSQRRDAVIADLEERVDEMVRLADAAQQAQRRAEQKCLSEQRLSNLLGRERDFLKAQLETYSSEEANLLDAALYDRAKTERLAKLEVLVEQYRAELEAFKDKLDAAQGAVNQKSQPPLDQPPAIASLLQDMVHLRNDLADRAAEVAMADKQIRSLEIANDRVCQLLGIGSYNAQTLAVLTFKNNPTDREHVVRTSQLSDLRKENEALLTRLHNREAPLSEAATTHSYDTVSHSENNGQVPQESFDAVKNRVAELQNDIEQKEKAYHRLGEAFRKKAADYKTAVAALLGYKFDIKESGQIRLSSIFAAAGTSRHLTFEPIITGSDSKPGKGFKLVGDGSGLGPIEQQEFQFWWNERRCWPGFLCSLFVASYEGSTRGGKHMGFVEGS